MLPTCRRQPDAFGCEIARNTNPLRAVFASNPGSCAILVQAALLLRLRISDRDVSPMGYQSWAEKSHFCHLYWPSPRFSRQQIKSRYGPAQRENPVAVPSANNSRATFTATMPAGSLIFLGKVEQWSSRSRFGAFVALTRIANAGFLLSIYWSSWWHIRGDQDGSPRYSAI